MSAKIEITRHNGGNPVHVGYLMVNNDEAIATIEEWVNESGGMADLIAMGEAGSTVPAEYELTGDECYEVVA